jgi:DNA (cytosine-5)-methyltransferase 1
MYKIGSLFSGIGGFELGLERALNATTAWQVEIDPYCRSILKKHWPSSKIYEDVKDVGAHNLEPVDIICGGFPCQDISTAGKQKGLKGEKSSLWFEMHRIISELRPQIAIIENTANIINRGGAELLCSLAQIGYAAEWITISARMFGAPHLRKRCFFVTYPYSIYAQIQAKGQLSTEQKSRSISEIRQIRLSREIKPTICFNDNGVSNRISRLKAIGNSIVPQCSEYIGRCIANSGVLDVLD